MQTTAAKNAKSKSAEAIKALRNKLKRPAAPRMSDIATEFITSFGGPKKFAEILQGEFNQARPGSSTRQKILDMIHRCLKYDGPRLDADALDDMDENDMMVLFASLVEQAGVLKDADEARRRDSGHAEAGDEVAGRDDPRGHGEEELEDGVEAETEPAGQA